jgi:hypothetical protein
MRSSPASEIGRRHRRNDRPPFRHHKAFRRQPAEYLTKRTDADAIALFERLEPQFLVRLQVPKNYVVSNATIAVVANGFSIANPFKHELISTPDLEKAI